MLIWWIGVAVAGSGELELLRTEAGLLLGQSEKVLASAQSAATAMPDSLRAYSALSTIEGSLEMEATPPSVAVARLLKAQEALRGGKPDVAFAVLEAMEGPEASALRMRVMVRTGRSRALSKEVGRYRAAYPGRVEALTVLWRTAASPRIVRIRQEVIEEAANGIEGDDLVLLYRAWKLFVQTGETNLALAAGTRIGKLEGTEGLPGRLPWGEPMIRDLARALSRVEEPVLPASATRQERAALWAEMSRLAQKAGESERSVQFERRAVSLGAPAPKEPATFKKLGSTTLQSSGGVVIVGEGAERPTILNLWASWCKPCREELPELAALAHRFEKEGVDVNVVAVSVDKRRGDYERYLRAHSVGGLATVWKPNLMESLGGEVLPTTYYIDTEGNILMERRGYNKEEILRLEELVRRVLE